MQERLNRTDDPAGIGSYHAEMSCREQDQCFVIDETTWQDLSMDEIFLRINTTGSSVGEEYLYHFLHVMRLEDGEDVLFADALKGEEIRTSFRDVFTRLGKMENRSAHELLNALSNAEPEKNTTHILQALFVLLSIVLIFCSPGIGVLLFVIAVSWSILSYFQKKSGIEPVLRSFSLVNRMLRAGREITKLSFDRSEEITPELKGLLKTFAPFSKSAFLLPSGTKFSENIFEIIFDYVRILFHVDLILYNRLLKLLQERKEDLLLLFAILGRLDASVAAADLFEAVPELTRPEFVKEKVIDVEDVFHPLLKDPVKNSIRTDGGILITGSNASGKSTFLRSVALCALFAQTIGRVPAASYRACRFKLFTSMALNDKILQGESYFIVELKSIKRILDAARETDTPVLCFVDEVLRGTNTTERIAASSRILSQCMRLPMICFAATHDLELALILADQFTNKHFEEEMAGEDVTFSYRLMDGEATSRNAIRLLKRMGFDEAVVLAAEEAADHYMQTGQWSVLK